jgi:quinol monooxygenase YgiN
MVVVTAVFRPRVGARDSLLAAMREAIPRVHQESGCELYCVQEEPDGTIFMIEKWESAEQLDAHGSGAVVAEFTRNIEGLLDEPVIVTRLVPIPIGDPIKGAL